MAFVNLMSVKIEGEKLAISTMHDGFGELDAKEGASLKRDGKQGHRMNLWSAGRIIKGCNPLRATVSCNCLQPRDAGLLV